RPGRRPSSPGPAAAGAAGAAAASGPEFGSRARTGGPTPPPPAGPRRGRGASGPENLSLPAWLLLLEAPILPSPGGADYQNRDALRTGARPGRGPSEGCRAKNSIAAPSGRPANSHEVTRGLCGSRAPAQLVSGPGSPPIGRRSSRVTIMNFLPAWLAGWFKKG